MPTVTPAAPSPGARLEPGPPAGPLITAGVGRVAALVVLSVAVHGWLLAHTNTTARDSIGFAQLAVQYENPAAAVTQTPCATPLDVLRHGEPPHPPGYPLAVLAASKVVRAVTTADLPDQMLLSTQIASVVAAVFLVVPVYRLGVTLFGSFAGLAAAAVVQVLPVVARVTSDGLTEAWYLLFYAASAAAATAAVRTPSAGGFFRAGAWSGFAYLVRPEGLLGALAAAAAVTALTLVGRESVGRSAGRLAAVALGVGLVAGPYMAAVGGLTLKPGGQGVIELAAGPVAAPVPLLAVSYNPLADGDKALWIPRGLFKEAFKAFHYGGLVYAGLGVGLAAVRVRAMPWLLPTLFLGAGNLMVLARLAWKAEYVSERHTLPVVLIGVMYAAYTMEAVPRLCRRLPGWAGRVFGWSRGRWVLLAALVGSCLPATIKPLHGDRLGHRLIGEYLKLHAGPEDVVIDPYTWAQYYSGRSVRGVPPDPAPARFRWAILEEGEGHPTLTRLKEAANVRDDTANPPTVVLRWDDPNHKGRSIVLYRQTVK